MKARCRCKRCEHAKFVQWCRECDREHAALRRAFVERKNGFRRGRHDAAVVRACEYLRSIEPDADAVPRLSDIRVRPIPNEPDGRQVHGQVEALRHGSLTIVINPESPFYARACVGEPLGLAMLLHHEQVHMQYGPDERPAYAATLALLDRVPDAPMSLRDVVRAAARANGCRC